MYRFILFIIAAFGITLPCFAASYSDAMNSSIEKRLVEYVHQTVSNLHYSSYKLGGTRFDNSKGVYVLDCSRYVDNILQNVSPSAYFNLVDSSGADTPNSQHYYDFINHLSSEPQDYWDKIDNVAELEPGDILVFRDKKARRRSSGGHVMMVMDKPIFDTDAFLVRVADSAKSGHSADTRLPHKSGIGIGTLLLKVNPKTGRPAAYAWKDGSCWKKNVKFAMGRPLEDVS